MTNIIMSYNLSRFFNFFFMRISTSCNNFIVFVTFLGKIIVNRNFTLKSMKWIQIVEIRTKGDKVEFIASIVFYYFWSPVSCDESRIYQQLWADAKIHPDCVLTSRSFILYILQLFNGDTRSSSNLTPFFPPIVY